MHPQIAIIVLSYNGLNVTKKFLNDLYNNTENFSIIMIDNGSTDGTKEYLLDFAKNHHNMLLTLNENNAGVINGRNQGYAIYKTMNNKPDLFMFLDNDQYVQKGWLEQHYDVMEHGAFDIVGVEAWLLNSVCFPVRQCKRPSDSFSYVGCGGMLIKSGVPEKIGMFDSSFNPCYFEDPDFCYRCRNEGFKIGWNYKPKLVHLAHQTLGLNRQRMENFKKSHAYFCSKWQKKNIKPIIQGVLPVLEN